MGAKEDLLTGLKPALTNIVKDGIAQGKLKQPVIFAKTSKDVWHRLQMKPATAGALLLFQIKREDIDTILKEVFADLKVEVK